VTPRNRLPFFNPQRRPNPEKNKPAAAAAIPHARRTGVQPKRERADIRPTNVIWSCIDRVRSLKNGMEMTLGGQILGAALLDKDYRSDGERVSITSHCEKFCNYGTIHTCKEIENFLLVPAAMDRAAARKVADQARRTGVERTYGGDAAALLDNFANERRSYVTSQCVTARIRFERTNSPGLDQATVTEAALKEVESCWNDRTSKLQVIPGKDALSMFNQYLQSECGVSVTPTAIVDAMRVDEIPNEMRTLLEDISGFARSSVE